MYNKLFTKILDSSIWLEPTTTRIVWLTFLAAMDEDGYCQFASIPNLAHRARVSLEEATEAVRCLESPDPHSSDPDNAGRRIERVPGGWIILNSPKYKELVTRAISREQTRLRVAKHRTAKKSCNADETPCNACVTHANDLVTPSETGATTGTETKTYPIATGRLAPDAFEKDLEGGKPERPPPVDLAGIAWGSVVAKAEKAARCVPAATAKDRRLWLKYAVLAELVFGEAWLVESAESARDAKQTKKSKQSLFVSILKKRAHEKHQTELEEFNGLAGRVEIPNDVWQSPALGGPRG